MSKKETPNKTVKPSLSQKERFIEYAREVEADESGERFDKAINKITKLKKDEKNV
ncbi:MAG: hypothetical protein JNL76_08265 [Alphaproteobacteria bacterium]|nr:hypothetical protein [Alphaproteobacteria bacterium]